MERKADGNFDAARGAILECKASFCTVKMREPIANVGNANAARGALAGRSGQASAGVGDFEEHAAVVAMSRDGELHGFVAGLHAVAQRIFDERLKDKLGDEGWEKRGIDVVRDGESGFEAPLHQFEIAAGDLQFLFEREFIRAGAAESEAEKIAELGKHGVSGANVFIHDGGDGVERVEKEMRLELKAKIFELRLCEACLELGGGKLLRLGDFEAFEEVIENDDDGEADQVVRILHGIAEAHDAIVVGAHA